MMPSKRSWLLVLILLSLALNVPNLLASGNVSPESAKSNSASPPAGEKEKENKPDSHTQEAQRSPSPPAETIKAISEPATETKKDSPKTETQNTVPGGRQEGLTWGSVSDWVLVIVAIITAFLALKSLRVIQIQTEAAQETAAAALEESRAVTLSERAYVKLSHFPPGIRFNNGYCGARICVKNFGRTPARVTAVVMAIRITEIEDPIPPPLTATEGPIRFRAFLVTNDEFSFTESKQIGDEMAEWLSQGLKRLFLYGYVDYIDQFGQRHRAGYARQYSNVLDDLKMYSSVEAFSERSNLDLLTEPKYNYDRHREIGEGFDWVWDNPAGPI